MIKLTFTRGDTIQFSVGTSPLTGITSGFSQLRSAVNGGLVAEFDITFDLDNEIVILRLEKENTELISEGKYVFDVQIDHSGGRTTIQRGIITIQAQVSKEGGTPPPPIDPDIIYSKITAIDLGVWDEIDKVRYRALSEKDLNVTLDPRYARLDGTNYADSGLEGLVRDTYHDDRYLRKDQEETISFNIKSSGTTDFGASDNRFGNIYANNIDSASGQFSGTVTANRVEVNTLVVGGSEIDRFDDLYVNTINGNSSNEVAINSGSGNQTEIWSFNQKVLTSPAGKGKNRLSEGNYDIVLTPSESGGQTTHISGLQIYSEADALLAGAGWADNMNQARSFTIGFGDNWTTTGASFSFNSTDFTPVGTKTIGTNTARFESTFLSSSLYLTGYTTVNLPTTENYEGRITYDQTRKSLVVFNGTDWVEISGGGNPFNLVEEGSSSFRPKTDGNVDLGESDHRFNDIWSTGTANLSSLIVSNSGLFNNSLMIGVKSSTPADTSIYVSNDYLTISSNFSGSDKGLKIGATEFSPIVSNEVDLGANLYRFKDAYIRGNIYLSGTLYANRVGQNFLPDVSKAHDLGSTTYRWRYIVADNDIRTRTRFYCVPSSSSEGSFMQGNNPSGSLLSSYQGAILHSVVSGKEGVLKLSQSGDDGTQWAITGVGGLTGSVNIPIDLGTDIFNIGKIYSNSSVSFQQGTANHLSIGAFSDVGNAGSVYNQSSGMTFLRRQGTTNHGVVMSANLFRPSANSEMDLGSNVDGWKWRNFYIAGSANVGNLFTGSGESIRISYNEGEIGFIKGLKGSSSHWNLGYTDSAKDDIVFKNILDGSVFIGNQGANLELDSSGVFTSDSSSDLGVIGKRWGIGYFAGVNASGATSVFHSRLDFNGGLRGDKIDFGSNHSIEIVTLSDPDFSGQSLLRFKAKKAAANPADERYVYFGSSYTQTEGTGTVSLFAGGNVSLGKHDRPWWDLYTYDIYLKYGTTNALRIGSSTSVDGQGSIYNQTAGLTFVYRNSGTNHGVLLSANNLKPSSNSTMDLGASVDGQRWRHGYFTTGIYCQESTANGYVRFYSTVGTSSANIYHNSNTGNEGTLQFQSGSDGYFRPLEDATYNLGGSSYKWLGGYFSGELIFGTAGRVNSSGSGVLNMYTNNGESSGFELRTSSATSSPRLQPSTDDGLDLGSTAKKWSDIHANGSVFSGGVALTSDKRIKSDITRIENALSTIEKINGYTYKKRYSIDGEESYNSIGLLAQDLHEVVPDAVIKPDNDEDLWSIQYHRLHAIQIEAIKELKAEIELIKEKINENK